MNSKELTGKPVLAIRTGKIIGKIRFPLIDLQKQEVTGFIIDDERWFMETKIIFFALIRGVRNDIATVEDESGMISISRMKALQSQLEAHVQLLGHKVVSETGKFLGYIEDFSFDTVTGKICVYKIKGKQGYVRNDGVISAGKELIVVSEESVSMGEEPLFQNQDEPGLDLNSIFERRQMEFVLGKRLSRSLESDSGTVIASEGQTVSMETVVKAKNLGKFTELVMSIVPGDTGF